MFVTKRGVPTVASDGGTPPAGRNSRMLVAACCLSVFMAGISTTALNVALPAIRSDLHVSVRGLQWTIDSYSLVIACLLLLAGSVADRYGRRRVFLIGLMVFVLASVGCALAPSVSWLIALRVLQAVGGSMLNPVALSIIANALTEKDERARAIGAWGAVFGLSVGVGPLIGGALVSAFDWRAVFLLNVPLGLVTIVLTLRHVEESRATRVRRFDAPGQALFILALAALTYGVIEGPGRFGSPLILGCFAIFGAAAAAFVAVELRARQPLLDVRFFRSPPLAGASVIAVLAFGVLAGFSFLSSLYLQQARGLSAVTAGAAWLPMAVLMAVLGVLSGRLVAQRGPRTPLVFSGLITAAGCTMLVILAQHTALAYVLVAFALIGAGLGLVNPPISTTAVSSMPTDQSGVAASVASTSRQVGAALGVAIVGLFISGADPQQLAHDSHPAWLLLAGASVTVAVLGLLSTSDRAATAARRNTDRTSGREPGPR